MKSTPIAILIATVLISGTLLIVTSRSSGASAGQNVSVANNVQTIVLTAKGGYFPHVSIAKAGIPTVLRLDTRGTYDCSAWLRTPSLSIAKLLPPDGSTEVALGTPSAGTVNGTCGMGMYNFSIRFQ